MPRKKTKSEKEYHAKVAQAGCVICGITPCEVHHKTGAGMGLRASHYDVIGLCPKHHRNGGYGVAVHGGVKEFEKIHGTQDALIEKTRERVEWILCMV